MSVADIREAKPKKGRYMTEAGYTEGCGAYVASLREEAYEAAASSSEQWLAESAEVIGYSQALDASETFSYFWDETPDEESFEMADIPGIYLPAPLSGTGRGRDALFVEAEPPASGLGWSMLLAGTSSGGGEELSHLNSVARKRGVATAAVGTDPGAVLMEPGLVERAGALMYFDHNPGTRKACRFYERLAGREEVKKWSVVIQLLPYALLDRELYGGRVQEPRVVYYLPVDESGRVRSVGSDEALPMVIPGYDPRTTDGETIGMVLARGHRPLILAVLFSLACAGADKGHHRAPQLRLAGRDSCGPLKRLVMEDRMGNLRHSLDGRGSARELGLSHALTVCRHEFGLQDSERAESEQASRKETS